MPVVRHRALYGENPQQSQYSAAGTLRVPYMEAKPREIKPGVFEIVTQLSFTTGHSVPLGYSWEVINMHIPVVVSSKIVPELGKIYTATITLALNVGSQNLFLFRQSGAKKSEIGSTGGFVDILFSESPPQSLVIPQGQELTGTVSVSARWEGEAEEDFFTFVLGAEKNLEGKLQRAESSINYRFV